MRRRLVHFLMGGLVLLVAALTLSPWWLGAALSLAGPRYGLSFEQCERIGFSRFALRRVVFRIGRTEVAADLVGTDTPVVWLWPRLDGLDLEVVADGSGAKLDHLVVRFEEQPVRVTGAFAVPADGWPAVRRALPASARTGSEFQLELPSSDVAAFRRFLPAFVAPTGTLDLKVNYRRCEFDGYVRLRDAVSKPLGPLGVLQEVRADARLQGRWFVVREVTATSGVQPGRPTRRSLRVRLSIRNRCC
jgi:hypothetical protein